MKLNGSDIIMEVLIEEGVDTVFGYPGGAALFIYDAIYKYRDKIKHIMPADETGACHAADGYARASGKTGVVIATSGPGATNLVTPLATAYMDSVPLIAITANVPESLIGKDSFQEVYIAGITMPITKHNFVVRDINDLADIIRKSFVIANTGRKGPVLIDIPKNFTFTETEFTRKEKFVPKHVKITSEDEKTIEEVAKLINESKRPIIYFGGGAKDSSDKLRKFMINSNIPSVHTLMGAGVLGYNEKLNIGLLGMHGSATANKVMNEADLILAVGTRFSDRVALNTSKFGGVAKKVHIDIDRSEINKNVHVDYSIIGDLNDVLDRFNKLVKRVQDDEWVKYLSDLRAKEIKEDSDRNTNKDGIYPSKVMDIIGEKTKDDAIYVTDVGQHQMWAVQYIRHTKPRSFITSGGLGTMGFGYGAALGVQVAKPNRRVIHITGDGSFYMNLNEVATAVEYDLPVITIILNNSTLGMVRQWQTIFYDKRYSSTDINKKMDYVKVAEGFGAKGFRCETIKEFETAFEEALKCKCPVWIECVIDKDLKVLPMIPAGGTIDDIIVD
ncbi:biosynthetic-type acetolactate synthase large subunit [Brachyspira hyodysenteriae]|uniref:biosynthetic-type acetolactate synthase large subunit n=1 Tax=Brachyspira hyodysenteriae TaxID=159 RepID=UPI00063DCF30|nr:biosynthetic-type acetolactate synthase large subunit [Brachyspira hyodysenteriae]KLI18381.1 acetolactate synthase catalytic subunit [Brachyspira hyodysenteriae]KLI60718.1 acetolactate synthase catalytic subunit [Brachyspira hyodysenteriae]MCZ9839410.1 biosynthetic-type acetolactate synthase large subunit [Brachyspira hyodysenteriae]MCZ9847059.1 biosynthetic-type acetolactate synthase large subunit [Brachyspira hyodysenteriae]MCZ9870019.1 biosynthetic-type acetolactate synthase large subuni